MITIVIILSNNMHRAKFVVVSNPCVQKSNNRGYSWGLLFLEEYSSVYLSDPIERSRIIALQTVSGKFLDEFWHGGLKKMEEEDVKIAESLKYWSVNVEIPQSLFEEKISSNFELICSYLRGTISGVDGDETVYKIPEEITELTKVREIRV